MAPRSSRSRDTVAWVDITPSAASRYTSWVWLDTAWSASRRATRCWRWGLASVRGVGAVGSALIGAPLGLRAMSGRPPGPGNALCLWFARPARSLLCLLDQPGQQAPEAVQPVVGLRDDPALWAVDHRGGHLLAPVGGEAVHEDRVGSGGRHDPVVDLEALERPQALLGLGLLAHGRPHVGVDHPGARHGLLRPGGDDRLGAERPQPVEVGVVGPVARRAGQADLHAQHGGAQR